MIRAFAMLDCAVASGSAQAQGLSGENLYLVAPYSAGGGADTLARAITQSLSTIWGQQVFVENKPGANTSIGAEYVARSAAVGLR